MPTHYHILGQIRPGAQVTPLKSSEFLKNSELLSATISNAMMRLGVSYTKAINKRFGRVGALFQGQFQGKPIKHYEHLLNLCVYIHANPVKDGLVGLPEEWEYSNYHEWMNLRQGTLVNQVFIDENFGTAREEYKDVVGAYIKTRNLPDAFHKYLQDSGNQ